MGHFAIVMDSADLNLYSIFLAERPDEIAIRKMMKQVCLITTDPLFE